MADTLSVDVQSLPYVEGHQSYLVPGGEKPVSETYGSGRIEHTHTGKYEDHVVRIFDARPLAGELALDRQGFRLVHMESAVTDFYDDAQVRARYYPEVEALIKRETGCTSVHIFDHTRRAGAEDLREEKSVRGPVGHVHNDYTEWSGPQRVRDLFPPEEAERLLRYRMQVVQVWRSMHGAVRTWPLGIIDARTIAETDCVPTERRYPDRVGEIYHMAFNPAHAWFYFPELGADEAIVFKCYDSKKNGIARFTAHGAFDDPTTPPGVPPRESIEVRAFAFFAPES